MKPGAMNRGRYEKLSLEILTLSFIKDAAFMLGLNCIVVPLRL